MKIFISWSGTLSHGVALELKRWLKRVIQCLDLYVSSEDLEKGTRYLDELGQELETTNYGIICLTKQNVQSPWIHYEAGALSKSISRSHVVPFLVDIDESSLSGTPLLQFQNTKLEKADILKLVRGINNACENSLDEKLLEEEFEGKWPSLSTKLEELKTTEAGASDTDEVASDPMAEIRKDVRFIKEALNSPDKILPEWYIKSILEQISAPAVMNLPTSGFISGGSNRIVHFDNISRGSVPLQWIPPSVHFSKHALEDKAPKISNANPAIPKVKKDTESSE